MQPLETPNSSQGILPTLPTRPVELPRTATWRCSPVCLPRAQSCSKGQVAPICSPHLNPGQPPNPSPCFRKLGVGGGRQALPAMPSSHLLGT